eukprot:6195784-Pleurochrysis_carterae.AAC.1
MQPSRWRRSGSACRCSARRRACAQTRSRGRPSAADRPPAPQIGQGHTKGAWHKRLASPPNEKIDSKNTDARACTFEENGSIFRVGASDVSSAKETQGHCRIRHAKGKGDSIHNDNQSGRTREEKRAGSARRRVRVGASQRGRGEA